VKKKTQIVIVGGGAGGLELARKLGAKYGRKNHDIILVDRNRSHIWKPLLHEVAAGSLDANMDEVGYGGHGARWGYRFFNGTLEGIDREKRQIITAPMVDADGNEVIGRHRIRYDYLVLAIGGVSNSFGIPGVEKNCLFLETRDQADTFRQKLLNLCLRVSHLAETTAERPQVRITIVGGGATGVELAAELYNAAESLKNYGLEVFDASRLKVTLLEAGPTILPALPEKLAEAAHNELVDRGVSVMTGAAVSEVQADRVLVKDGDPIESDVTVWAAGVKGHPLLATLDGLETDRADRLVVKPSLQTTRDDRIFAIGDCCACRMPESERNVPPRAQAAHQMAACVFKNIVKLNDYGPGAGLEDFSYHDHGSLVSLSRYSTVGSLMGNLIGGRMAIEGRLARFAYLSLYRMHLLSIHGLLRGTGTIVVNQVNQVVRPKLKVH
jgi:NADH dehydrogenase